MLGWEWHRDEAGSGIGRADIAARRIDVDADEIDRSTDRVHVLSGGLRSVRAGGCQEGVAVAAFHDRGQVRCIELAGGELGRRACIVFFYAPRTGGAYGSHHRTAGIAGRTRRRGCRVAARGARAAAWSIAAPRRAHRSKRPRFSIAGFNNINREDRMRRQLAAFVASSGTPMAHHSFAMFDQENPIELEGTVQEFKYTSPHSYLLLAVKGPDGSTTVPSNRCAVVRRAGPGTQA